MAKTRPGKRDVDSYTIRGTNKVVKGIARDAYSVDYEIQELSWIAKLCCFESAAVK